MDPFNLHLRQVLKAARAQRGWSLGKAAQETGVSKAMLGQIERGESSPTVATLWKLATGFALALSDFLPPGGSAPLADSEQMSVVPVFAFDPALGFEMLAITLAPGERHVSEPHATGVVEHVVPLNGTLEVLHQDVWETVAAGAGLRFKADAPHGYANPGVVPLCFHNLVFYP
ncbi:XRE family transcriptional regulator [Granulosicoccaceae sp. 1_MG-2023]|nr:XRE family transcriptional regulator [Granulosicoccaceae sp. 1_MG-2023]